MSRVKMADAREFKVEYVPIEEVERWPRNPKKHELNVLEKSIRRFGFVQPVVVDQSTGKLVAGHGRLEALVRMKEHGGIPPGRIRVDGRTGGWLVPVLRGVRFSNEREAEAYLVADNRIVELGGWDDSLLIDMLREMQDVEVDLSGTGFSAESIMEMISEMSDKKEVVEDKGPGEIPAKPITKLGDLWEMGAHRLLCGDSSYLAAVDKLMDGQLAPLIFTDPPYNVGEKLQGENSNAKSRAVLKGSDWDKGFNFEDFQANLLSALSADASVYVCSSHHTAPAIWAWMNYWSNFNSYCVWHKQNPMPSLSKRHWTWSTELICYATRGKHVFNFPAEGHAPNVWSFTKEAKCDLHPTMKPIAVCGHAISHSSKPGDLVADLFAGSGSTIIACEKLGRKCRALEIEPKYCDAIVNRWEKFTGRKAIRASKAVDV